MLRSVQALFYSDFVMTMGVGIFFLMFILAPPTSKYKIFPMNFTTFRGTISVFIYLLEQITTFLMFGCEIYLTQHTLGQPKLWSVKAQHS